MMKIFANQYLIQIIAIIQSHETVKNENKINRKKTITKRYQSERTEMTV